MTLTSWWTSSRIAPRLNRLCPWCNSQPQGTSLGSSRTCGWIRDGSCTITNKLPWSRIFCSSLESKNRKEGTKMRLPRNHQSLVAIKVRERALWFQNQPRFCSLLSGFGTLATRISNVSWSSCSRTSRRYLRTSRKPLTRLLVDARKRVART